MQSLPPLPEWVKLEHQVAQILTQQEIHGWYFDEQSARELESALRTEYEAITKVLLDRYPYVAGKEFTPKRNNKSQGYIEGCTFTRLKDFNPSSRDHIAEIGTDTALKFLTLLDLTKQLGMISEGVNAWQKLCTKSRIHHYCATNTATFRCHHRTPNLGQVPADERFRRLFTATPGQRMVAADLSGIELRMLAHYLARYDGGRYANILTTGDIHQTNADKIGISRRQVKTVTYAFLYGCGDIKLGHSYDQLLSEEAARKKGKEIRKAYVDAIPGLAELLEATHRGAERGYASAIDGRRISVDKRHKFLNYLLQGGAAVIAKRWMVRAHEHIKDMSLCCNQLAFIHDELQFECDPKHVEDLKSVLELSAVEAGEYYNMRIPIAAEAKDGETWADTH
jgi:DNA polymerase I-like protein with 3'-5' exonuclease and polymerase domains